MKNNQIKRHTGLVRFCHWLIALSGLFLCFTGIGTMPLYGRFFVNSIPGLSWSSDLLLQLRLHSLGAGIFALTGQVAEFAGRLFPNCNGRHGLPTGIVPLVLGAALLQGVVLPPACHEPCSGSHPVASLASCAVCRNSLLPSGQGCYKSNKW